MKKQYKEIRKIHASALRQLCIDRDWYTAGDNDEYGHLLFDLADSKENLSTADIIEIAEDIMAHSDLDAGYTVESVAFEVVRIACVFFEEVEDNMKKYYADIFHAKSNTCITIGEYSEKDIEKSIRACIKQRGFKINDCVWQIRIENM